ncbi:MAG: peptidylprolyl isomerase [Chloroflexales bacterium]|nr:peptidylprolyl isomerase [Chloroflexales bacterium]
MFALLLVLTLAACASTDQGALVVPGGPLAIEVGDCAVLCRQVRVAEVQQRFDDEFRQPIAEAVGQGQTREQIEQLAQERGLRTAIVDQIVQEELLGLEARRMGVGVDPKVVDDALAQEIQPGDAAALGASKRVSRARYFLALEAAARLITATQYHVRVIQVASQAEAQSALNRLNAGEPFAEVARQVSQEPVSAPQGGDLGWLPQGTFAPEVEQLALNVATPLDAPQIVVSQGTFYVVAVAERAAERDFQSFDQLRKVPNAGELYEQWFQQFRADAEKQGRLKLLFDPNTLAITFTQ